MEPTVVETWMQRLKYVTMYIIDLIREQAGNDMSFRVQATNKQEKPPMNYIRGYTSRTYQRIFLLNI